MRSSSQMTFFTRNKSLKYVNFLTIVIISTLFCGDFIGGVEKLCER